MNTNSKPFRTYEQQLELLKSRGLAVEDDQSALHWLERTNYYRLSAYSLTMRKSENGEDRFYEGSTFSQITELYLFDKALRNILFSASSTIEIQLRAYMAYWHSQKYSPLGYLDPNNFEDPWKHAAWLNSISTELRHLKKEPFVVHHREHKDNTYPFWVITEVCTFGQLSTTYKNLLPEDRTAIAKNFFNIPSREYVENWLYCSTAIRNICAHGGRFYNRINMNPPVKLGSHVPFSNTQPGAYIYALYKLLPQEVRQEFIQQIKDLFNTYPFALPKFLGFPDNWEDFFT